MKKTIFFILLLTPILSLAVPPSIVELTMISHGKRLPGLIYQAAGEGPHPTAVLLHGYPGNEKNLDVAQALRSKGWNVVYFNYRGAWGAEGDFSFINSEQDVQSVIKYLLTPENSATLRIDPKRLSLVGHSMGGHMAIAGLLDNNDVVCAIAYDGANLGANGKGIFANPDDQTLWKDYSNTLFMLKGWNGDKAFAEINNHGTKLDLNKRTKTLNDRPVLLISADTTVIPEGLHIQPLLKSLQNSKTHQSSYLLIDDDHSFSASRAELIDATYQFLDKHCA